MSESLQPGEDRGGDPSPPGDLSPDPERAPESAPVGSDAPPPDAERQPAQGEDDPESSPELATPLRQLDPRWVTAERASGAILGGILVVGSLVALLIFGRGWRALGFSAWVVLTIVLFAGAMIGPVLQYRRARYRVTPFGIEIHWGVLWRRVTIVPRSRIQHTDVEQGPLLRRFGLAKLVIHTAGTEHSTVPLYGLAMPEATSIRDDLMGRAGEATRAAALVGDPGAGDGV